MYVFFMWLLFFFSLPLFTNSIHFFVSTTQMSHFSVTLDSVRNGVGLFRRVWSHATPKINPVTIASPFSPTIDLAPSAVEAPACASPEPSCPSPPPRQDKGKQLTEDQQQKKKKWVDEGYDASAEVQEGSVMADARRKARCERREIQSYDRDSGEGHKYQRSFG